MSVKSAERVLKVFELLAQHQEGLTIKSVSEFLSIPQSSTSGLIETMFLEGFLTVDSSKRYRLGPKLIHLGHVALDSLDISTQGIPFLKDLMEDVQETVFMAILADSELAYVAKINSKRSIRTTAQPGLSKPLYCTGLGKTFLTFLPEEVRDELLSKLELKPITPKTITSVETLKDQLKSFAEMGYSIDDEENEEGLICFAAPVFGADRIIHAAISIAGPKERMVKQKDFIVGKLLETSRKIANSIGYK
ncbi:IclR family transcriptional regulator [Neobacillus sp. PS3-40]|uniref:IclR family transcriptional regulator n=1 Tax=Neobacillus sp. PS3-40 TaxID=3070679 RepID=UPI0027E0B525|nr:IclR family transcriptional regulator [Neobacillus sp. PS3-40]WML43968.1 IclR family transcriptional regulator [Neobacillus sp. PS3-40]